MIHSLLSAMALFVGVVVCQGVMFAADTRPSWLLPQASEGFLKESPTGLFPDFYSSPVFPFVIDPNEQIVKIELKEMTAAP